MEDPRKPLAVLESAFPFVFFTESFSDPADFRKARIAFFHNRFGQPQKDGGFSPKSAPSVEHFFEKMFTDRNQRAFFFDEIGRKGEIQEFEVTLNEKFSLLKRCQISSKIIRLQKGEFYLQGYFLGLPQRLKELENSLHQENKMLETILSGIGDAVCVYDTQCRVIFQSPLHSKWFPDPSPYMCFNRNRNNNGSGLSSGPETFIEKRRVNGGKQFCVEVTTHPIKNEAGKLFAGINIVRDLSLNLELEAKSRELEKIKQTRLLELESKKFIGESREIKKVLDAVHKISRLNTVVFIQGETGTGKELIARAIHDLSLRADKPFVAINCGALPETLLDSELFGHAKGAFTGAETESPGLFEAADGGTIFLDEIGEMSLGSQVKLLRVLQDGEKRKLGSTKNQKVDVRVITATHRDIESLVKENKFRADLFYRIHVFTIHTPPLREREDDILLLADFFLREFSAAQNKPVRKISMEAALLLKEHSWPGNIRELRNIIERAIILCESDTLQPQDLPLTLQKPQNECRDQTPYSQFLEENLKDFTKKKILSCLEQNRWNKTVTAKALNISRATLWRKIKEYSIPNS